MDATPGLAEGGNEFYSVAGAERLAGIIPTFSQGHAVIGVCGAPFKCPPAPSECALLLHDELTARGVREACQISFVIPLGTPGAAVAGDLGRADRGVRRARHHAASPGGASARSTRQRRVAILDDGAELPFDLFLGVPKHRAPDVVIASGMTEDGYIPVNFDDARDAASPASTRWATSPRRACRRPACSPRAPRASWRRRSSPSLQGGERPGPHLGQGHVLHRVRAGRVGSVDIDFLSGPTRTGTFNAPSAALAAEKERFGSSRRARWFGL